MKPECWREVERLYHLALERPENERNTFLREASAEDQSLVQEVESLLAHHSKGENFLQAPALELAAKVLARAPGQPRGSREAEPLMVGKRFRTTASWTSWAAGAWVWSIRPRTPGSPDLSP